MNYENIRHRWRHWLKRIAQGGVLGVVVVALATLRSVDHAPWLPTEPAQHALE